MKNCPTCGTKIVKRLAHGGKSDKEAPDDGSSDDNSSDAAEDDAPETPSDTSAAEEAPPAEAPAETPPDEATSQRAAALAHADAGTELTASKPDETGESSATVIPDDNVSPDGTITVIGQKPTAMQQLQLANNEDQAFKADVSQGVIDPKTMQQYFNDKSLPGKLGTIFGLLLSGAGSGLAHQQNAMMDMIQKELDRDLQGQIQSAHNKQSWYQLGLQHDMQNATIPGITATSTMNRMRTAMAYGIFSNLVNSMPPGPGRDMAMKTLQQIQGTVDTKNAQDTTNALGRSKLKEALEGLGKRAPALQSGEPIDLDRLQALRQAGNFFHMPGQTMSEAEANQVLQHEYPALAQNRLMVNSAMKSFNALQNMAAAGQGAEMAAAPVEAGASLIPFAGKATAKLVGDKAEKFQTARNAEIQKLVSLGMNKDEAENLMPSGYDLGSKETRAAKMANIMEILKNREETLAPLAKSYGLLTEFPTFSAPPSGGKAGSQAEAKPKSKKSSERPMIQSGLENSSVVRSMAFPFLGGGS